MRPRLLPALLFSMLLSACAAPSYYVQAAAGHLELMRQREAIDELLADSETEPELAATLQQAQDILAFGRDRLGLPDSGAYRQYAATGREAVTWNVVAAPEFSLQPKTWCFLIAGCVPYRGYFEHDKARRFAGKLDDRGFDVIVAPVAAYSTLGWFDDPLLDTMPLHDSARLAGTLFHEMAHQALYVKNDTAFNESFAGFVEETGVQLWLESRGAAESYEAWRSRRERAMQVNRVLAQGRVELDRLYASDLTPGTMRERKGEVFERLCQSLREPGPRDGTAAPCRLNNASLALRQAYHGGSCAFAQLYHEVSGNMKRFIERATEQSKLPAEARQAWLSGACRPVAPGDDL